MLLSEKADAVDHLLGSRAGCLEAVVESGILLLKELDALRRDDTFRAGDLEALETSLGLEGAAAERGELVTEMLDELLQLREGGSFRSCAV
jgi:hypothetical protein